MSEGVRGRASELGENGKLTRTRTRTRTRANVRRLTCPMSWPRQKTLMETEPLPPWTWTCHSASCSPTKASSASNFLIPPISVLWLHHLYGLPAFACPLTERLLFPFALRESALVISSASTTAQSAFAKQNPKNRFAPAFLPGQKPRDRGGGREGKGREGNRKRQAVQTHAHTHTHTHTRTRTRTRTCTHSPMLAAWAMAPRWTASRLASMPTFAPTTACSRTSGLSSNRCDTASPLSQTHHRTSLSPLAFSHSCLLHFVAFTKARTHSLPLH